MVFRLKVILWGNDMGNLKGWRTIILGALIAGLGSIQATDLATVVPEHYVGLVLGAVGVLIMWMRTITNTPVGTK